MATEDIANLLGIFASLSIGLLSVTLLLDLSFTLCALRILSEMVILIVVAALCFQGETRYFYAWHEWVTENAGFCMRAHGRGFVYFIMGCFALGGRCMNAEVSGGFLQTMWLLGGTLQFIAGSLSLYIWRQHRANAMRALDIADGVDAQQYYTSAA